ncbi:MAG TPA: DUF2807 domain-containing protein [Candidatus Alistipes avicola]|uniref:DUF2807 domain-containing protein n=1 Tax=Candidatus Alistipes avicola TaxID=2838432 RepID=A0A9D2ID82_9BACT|nr:DUF2807 domain-containing protein [uncultured Alistipes sp.]HJA98416.1 DUF2807 domain-containing protein [Candidatus Alistipes avicola]
MKRWIMALIVAIAALMAMTACAYVCAQKTVEGSGTLTTRNVPVGEFESVKASRGVKVVIADRTGDVEVQADDNLIQYITVEQEGKTLRISVEEGIQIRSMKNIVVSVPYNAGICKLDASSAAKILVDRQLVADEVELEASSAGAIRADVKTFKCSVDLSSSASLALQVVAAQLEVDSSSASKALLQGAVKAASFDASSASSIKAPNLTVQKADVDCSSAAWIRLRCDRQLDARATSGATVYYEGSCSVRARSNMASIQRVK